MRGLLATRFIGALVGCACAAAVVSAPAAAQGSYSPYNETAAAALARYVRTLASDPKDFDALIGAGRAALELGDTQAAAGFFARADDVNPRSPLPQAGMGAVSVANGNAQAALPYFKRAQQLGASLPTIGCDLGLAYDLLGKQAAAQADYRAALNGPDADEARRRLALSLAISGDKIRGAGSTRPVNGAARRRDRQNSRLRPCADGRYQRRDGRGRRGDAGQLGARCAVPSAPAISSSQGRRRRPSISVFSRIPDDAAYAYAAPARNYSASSTMTASETTNRLAGVDDLLRATRPAVQAELATRAAAELDSREADPGRLFGASHTPASSRAKRAPGPTAEDLAAACERIERRRALRASSTGSNRRIASCSTGSRAMSPRARTGRGW